jgi:hypothetical protein
LNGSNVGLNSATYTSDATLAAGSYDVTVTVTNAVSSATSATVTLTVGPLVVTLPGSLPLSMTPIAAGTFTMGAPVSDPDYNINGNDDEGPQHQVTISQNFYMGTYLLTQAQWKAVMGSNPSYFSTAGGGSGTDDLQRPVEQVSWNDIATSTTSPTYTCFLDWLNANMATICPLCRRKRSGNTPAGLARRRGSFGGITRTRTLQSTVTLGMKVMTTLRPSLWAGKPPTPGASMTWRATCTSGARIGTMPPTTPPLPRQIR